MKMIIRLSRKGPSLKVSGAAFLVCLAALFAAAQQEQDHSPAAGEQAPAMSRRYEDLKWQPVVPELGKDSPQISILRVDPKTNATQLLILTPAKMHVPMHWHSANETHTMIKGTATFEHDGKLELLGPGGFNYMPAKMKHQAWTSAGSLVMITVDGAWDVNWAGPPPGKSDLGQSAPSGK